MILLVFSGTPRAMYRLSQAQEPGPNLHGAPWFCSRLGAREVGAVRVVPRRGRKQEEGVVVALMFNIGRIRRHYRQLSV